MAFGGRELRIPTISLFCRDSESASTEMCLFNFNVHYSFKDSQFMRLTASLGFEA